MRRYPILAAVVLMHMTGMAAAQVWGDAALRPLQQQKAVLIGRSPGEGQSAAVLNRVILTRLWRGSDADLEILRDYAPVRHAAIVRSAVASNATPGILTELVRPRVLSIRGASAGQITGACLASVARSTTLQELRLKDVPVADSALRPLEDSPALNRVQLWNTGVSLAAVARLKRALPDCAVSMVWQADARQAAGRTTVTTDLFTLVFDEPATRPSTAVRSVQLRIPDGRTSDAISIGRDNRMLRAGWHGGTLTVTWRGKVIRLTHQGTRLEAGGREFSLEGTRKTLHFARDGSLHLEQRG